MLQGQLEVSLGDERIEAAAGSVLYFPWGVRHAYRKSSEGPARILVTFTPARFEEFYSALHDLVERHGGAEPPPDEAGRLRGDSDFPSRRSGGTRPGAPRVVETAGPCG